MEIHEPVDSNGIEIIAECSSERLRSELDAVKSLGFFTVELKNDDVFMWRVSLDGPIDTPYENGVFAIKINFASQYPNIPPMLSFKTQIFHPNVDAYGIIQMDMLQPFKWSSTTTALDVLMSVRNLLITPDVKYAGNPQATMLYQMQRDVFETNAKKWTKKYAKEAKTNFGKISMFSRFFSRWKKQ